MTRRPRGVLIVATALAALLYGCADSGSTETPDAGTDDTSDADATDDGTTTDDGGADDTTGDDGSAAAGGADDFTAVWLDGGQEKTVVVLECTRPAEGDLTFRGESDDALVVDASITGSSGEVTVRTPGTAGSAIAEESGPATLTSNGATASVSWLDNELQIACGS